MEVELTPIIKESFLQYAGAVLQSRALVDVRDLCKPSARQIFYCLYTDKFIHSKPFHKTVKAIGNSFRLYIHGDSSAEGIIMRAGQPFSMRYPLIDVEGSYGTLLASGSWAAPRYTGSRLSELSEYLFADINKDTIEEWRDNYDNTEQYPSVLPSKGYYNIVNGSYGIGVGASSSIPQYNLKEVNNALITLLWNEDASFDDIYCVPDFATGAILLNADEVKESHKNGNGKACKLRSVVEFDSKDRCLIVKEIPYMVYTETICGQLEDIINGDNNPGIERFNDLTGEKPCIKIYLSKGANPSKIMKFLYKNTSLEYYYPVNLTMLDNGRYPKIFTWREALLAHLSHEKQVYIRGFNYDLNKINERLHIIEGLFKAISMIDEVVRTIKSSSDTRSANLALQKLLSIDEAQAKAILEIKLARLAHLEIDKLLKEKNNLELEQKRITSILNDETLLKKEIEKGLREVANKFGDARRTQILNLNSTSEDEVVEEKQLIVSLTNYGNILTEETSTLIVQRRGGVGSKIKLNSGECVIDTITDTNIGTLMLFSNKGRYYSYPMSELNIKGARSIYDMVKLQDGEQITNIMSFAKAKSYKYIVFVTKDGMLKKSLLEEYKAKKSLGAQGIKLKDGDEIVSICFMNDERLGILTKFGQFAIINTKDVNPIGKVAMGVRGMKLNDGDCVCCARPVYDDVKSIVSVSSCGMASKTPIGDCPTSNRDVKGYKLQKLGDNDTMCGFVGISGKTELTFTTSSAVLKMDSNAIAETGRGAIGVKGMKVKDGDRVLDILAL